MGGDQAQLVLTDPPYGVSYEPSTRPILNDDLTSDALEAFITAALKRALEVTDRGRPDLRLALRRAGKRLPPRDGRFRLALQAGARLGQEPIRDRPPGLPVAARAGPVRVEARRRPHRWYGGRRETTVIDDDVDLRSAEQAGADQDRRRLPQRPEHDRASATTSRPRQTCTRP
jgi:hypothetical protein